MPISGSTKAKMVARLGIMRMGASRLDYYLPNFLITINGVNRSTTGQVRVEGLSIRDLLDGTPNTATIRVDGFTPVKGHEIKIALGQLDLVHYVFAGHILSTMQVYEGKPANVAWDLSCISYEWLLNRRKVIKKYTAQSATAIVLDLMASFTSGFTTTKVQTGVPTIDEITFTNEEMTDALDRVARRIGANWVVDYAKDLYFGTTASGSAHSITDSDDHGATAITQTVDLSQVRDRILVEGGGSTAVVEVAVGSTTLPLEDSGRYNASGGTVVAGPQRITYTGKSALDGTGSVVIGKPLSPGTPSAAVVANTAGNLSVGDYRYKTSFVTPDGESDVSAASSAASVANISAPGALTAAAASGTSGNLTVGSRTYKITYVTAAGETDGGTASGSVTISHVSAPTGSANGSGTTGGSLTSSKTYSWVVTFETAAGETVSGPSGAVALGASDTAISLTSIPTSADGRVTKRRIYRTGADYALGYLLDTTINDNSTTTATLTKADSALGVVMPSVNTSGSGQGSLTSIPTSGDGRVTKRRIYRTVAGGSTYKLLTTINDNSTTTYTDNTADGSLGADLPTTNTSGSGQMSVTSIPIGPAGTTARRVYRTEAGGSIYKFLATINDNSTTSYTDNIADNRLGDEAPAVSEVGAAVGDTTLRVKDLAQFSGSGGWVKTANLILRYTGRSAASGEGTLTGVPASGVGAITAKIPFDSAVTNAPHLTGVSGIAYTIKQGEPVNLLVTRNDTTAQSNMAGFVGGDGIVEEYIQDGRLSEAEAIDRGDAQLELAKDPLVTMTYQTRDQQTRSGREVMFSLSAPTSISGTYKIQSVTLSGFDPLGRTFPLRQVEASSRRFSFEQILRLLKAA